ncbi:hypothetical protein ACWDLG_36695 [Nonomuraea sp. NPDC003727]
MLQPDPAQAMRLAEIITNLHDRIREATERGWLGEVEGLHGYPMFRRLRVLGGLLAGTPRR